MANSKCIFTFVFAIGILAGFLAIMLACGNATISDLARTAVSSERDSKPGEKTSDDYNGGDGGGDGGGGGGDDDTPPPDAEGGTVLWTFEADEEINYCATVSNGKVFFLSENKTYCLDAFTGLLIWDYSSPDSWNSPAVVDGKVYFMGSDFDGKRNIRVCKVVCMIAETGELVWERTFLEFGIVSSSSVAFSEDYSKLFIAYNCAAACLNPEDGEIIWSVDFDDINGGSTPAIKGEKLFMLNNADSQLCCLNINDGSVIWSTPVVRGFSEIIDNYTSASVTDDYLIIANKQYDLDGNNIWTIDSPSGESEIGGSEGLAIVGDKVYGIHSGSVVGIGNGPSVRSYNTVDGSQAWEYKIVREIDNQVTNPSPAVAGNYVYGALMKTNKIVCLNRNNGVLVWEFEAGNYTHCSPVVWKGRLYVGARDHIFYCLSAKEAFGDDWPTFKYNYQRTGYKP